MTKLSRAKLPKEVRDCIAAVRSGLNQIDEEMKKPSTHDRGAEVARACNSIEMAIDLLGHFGIKERKPRKEPVRMTIAAGRGARVSVDERDAKIAALEARIRELEATAPLSRTAQAMLFLVRAAGARGIGRRRLAQLLYLADYEARRYLGHPITDIAWTREML